jgi:hypothetical protein
MWTTSDGYQLRLPPSGLGTIIPQLRRPGMWDAVRSNFRGSFSQAATRTLASLARAARYAGNLYAATARRVYPVFRAVSGVRVYELVTRPLAGRTLVIIAVRLVPEDAESFDVSGTATIAWDAPRTLTAAVRASPGVSQDVYILERRVNGRWMPYYVGRTDDPGDRLQKHRRDILRHKNKLSDFRVRVGHIQTGSTMTPAQVERVLIRKTKRTVPGVTNAGADAKPFRVPQGQQVLITHQGNVPRNVPRYVIDRRRKGRVFQLRGGAQGRQYETGLAVT